MPVSDGRKEHDDKTCRRVGVRGECVGIVSGIFYWFDSSPGQRMQIISFVYRSITKVISQDFFLKGCRSPVGNRTS